MLTLNLITYKISVFSPNTGKYKTEKTPYLDTFHAVNTTTKLSDYHVESVLN